ncbi:MAG: glycoside hydrolase family 3 C-terminal domain-containing protein [Clostridiaceae bacterium]|jgi:beta-glucosidase|nr:glycoside hydrolase family 3 C-terminal domain-containing protein [Clostridiaceae bacterium]
MGKYDELISKLTIEEKAGLLSGATAWLTKRVDRLGIPDVWMADGPHGLRKERTDAPAVNIMKPSEPSTCFPTAVATGSSWDRALIGEIGTAIAEEAKHYGVSTVLGPGVNIKRSPLCGRNFEYISEDPYLAGEMGTAYVKGVQSTGVGTSLKHFAANNQEYLRMSIDSRVDERALREIYLAPFEKVVKEAAPATVMCSYNKLNGEYLSDSKRLLTDILRDEWGFKGMVVSDWSAVNERIAGVRAGMDLQMPANGGVDDKRIVAAVKSGKLAEADVDKCVERVLNFVFTTKKSEDATFKADFAAHRALAKRAAAESAVLLKNNGALPLSKTDKIAVIGQLADHPRYQGNGSSRINPFNVVSFKQHLENSKVRFDYAPGYTQKGDGYSDKLLSQALDIAKNADKVVIFAGLTDVYESEGFDREHLDMPRGHVRLIEEISKINKNTVVVLVGGSPVRLPFMCKVNALLNMYLSGEAGGEAASDLLFGVVSPSGKLAETYPVKLTDSISEPYFGMGPFTVEYRESIFVGYRYYDTAEIPVQFPFGFGLSYTKFEYSDFIVDKKSLIDGESLTASFNIKNVGKVSGAETAQIYVAAPKTSVFKPAKELKGFEKVFLNPGEEKSVSITLDPRAFKFYNTAISDWYTESGEYQILAGASSKDIRLSENVNVTSSAPDAPLPDFRADAPGYYDIKHCGGLPQEQFEALYGSKSLSNEPAKRGEFTINSTIQDIAVTSFGRFTRKVLRIGLKIISSNSENAAMLTKSADYMPLRSATGWGSLSPYSVFAAVDIYNGVKGSVKKFFKGFLKKYKNIDPRDE